MFQINAATWNGFPFPRCQWLNESSFGFGISDPKKCHVILGGDDCILGAGGESNVQRIFILFEKNDHLCATSIHFMILGMVWHPRCGCDLRQSKKRSESGHVFFKVRRWFQECFVKETLVVDVWQAISWEQNGNFLTYCVYIIIIRYHQYLHWCHRCCLFFIVCCDQHPPFACCHDHYILYYFIIICFWVSTSLSCLLFCHVCCDDHRVSSHIQQHFHHHPQIKRGWLFHTGVVF